MKLSKILILLTVLSFPVILYLLLTFYGNNEFDLPVYFEERNEQCEDFVQLSELTDTLHKKDSSSVNFNKILQDHINVIAFPDSKRDNQQLINELNRVLATLSDEAPLRVHSVFVEVDSSFHQSNEFLPADNAYQYLVEPGFYHLLSSCYLALPTEEWVGEHPAEFKLERSKILVLVDRDLRIRGYFNGEQTKDVDRLILEIRILLSKSQS